MPFSDSATVIQVGDKVWSKEHPSDPPGKVIGIEIDPVHGSIKWAYVEDSVTKEVTPVLAEFLSNLPFENKDSSSLWRDVWKPQDTPLCVEVELFKKASLVDDSDSEAYHQVMLPYLDRLGLRQSEQFVRTATLKADGDIVFYYEEENDRMIVATVQGNEVKAARFVCSGKEVHVSRFTAYKPTICISSMGEDGYCLEIHGSKKYIDEFDLEQFCQDWKLDPRVVRSSITKNGRYTVSKE